MGAARVQGQDSERRSSGAAGLHVSFLPFLLAPHPSPHTHTHAPPSTWSSSRMLMEAGSPAALVLHAATHSPPPPPQAPPALPPHPRPAPSTPLPAVQPQPRWAQNGQHSILARAMGSSRAPSRPPPLLHAAAAALQALLGLNGVTLGAGLAPIGPRPHGAQDSVLWCNVWHALVHTHGEHTR